jgi:hypothetical protein
MRRLIFLAVLLAGCSDSAGPSLPNLRGGYALAYTASVTEINTGEYAAGACAGTMSITGQSGGTFSGSFIIQASGDNCDTQSGTVSGQVRPDGGVNFVLGSPGSGTGIPGCTYTSHDTEFNGVFSANRITATMDANMVCFPSGSYRVEWQIIATRS